MKFEKTVEKAKNFMKKHNYEHPSILKVCSELKLSPEELKEKTPEEFREKCTSSEIQKLRFNHFEARRRGKVEIVAKTLANDCEPKKLSSTTPKPRKMPSLLSIDEITKLRIQNQKTKLKKYLKFQENLKNLKISEEQKKAQILKKEIQKFKKLELEKKHTEDQRLKKIMESNSKRQEKLDLKHLANLERENRALSQRAQPILKTKRSSTMSVSRKAVE